jgi:hypothetical protein
MIFRPFGHDPRQHDTAAALRTTLSDSHALERCMFAVGGTPQYSQSMRLRSPLLQLVDARKERSENWGGVGLIVADDEIDRRCLTIERTAGHGPSSHKQAAAERHSSGPPRTARYLRPGARPGPRPDGYARSHVLIAIAWRTACSRRRVTPPPAPGCPARNH